MAILLVVAGGFGAFVMVWHGRDAKAVGGGPLTEEARSVRSFDEIDARGAVRVEVRAGTAQSVRVRAEANVLPYLHTEVSGTTLKIFVDDKVEQHGEVVATISVPTVRRIEASGATTVVARELDGTREVQLRGASNLDATGRTDELRIDAMGASSIGTSGLYAERLTVHGSGAIHGTVRASRSIDINLAGASALTVVGHPTQVHRSTTGASFLQFD
jgi:hypothetical protein